jgi:hypothetical protein
MGMPEEWFVAAIKDGLKALVSLRLDGTPAVDLLPTTRDIWIASLWQGRQWHEPTDRERLHRAFVALACDSTRWPAPADLRARIPKRAQQKALPAAEMSEDQRRANLARMRSIVAEVLGG